MVGRAARDLIPQQQGWKVFKLAQGGCVTDADPPANVLELWWEEGELSVVQFWGSRLVELGWTEKDGVGLIHALALQMKKLKQKLSSDRSKPTQSEEKWQTSDYHSRPPMACNLWLSVQQEKGLLNNMWVVYVPFIWKQTISVQQRQHHCGSPWTHWVWFRSVTKLLVCGIFFFHTHFENGPSHRRFPTVSKAT